MNNREQTLEEERINAITHGLGVVFTLCAIPLLLKKTYVTGSFYAYWAVLIFGFGMLAVYSFSTLYHSTKASKLKHTFNIYDQASIFILIGGSYLPFLQHYIDAQTAIVFLIFQWLIIGIGVFLKVVSIKKHENILFWVYIVLGWSVVFLAKPLMQTMDLEVVKWIVLGGISYSIGTIFYRWKSKKYAHAVWHIFVLGGTICHYWAAYRMYELYKI